MKLFLQAEVKSVNPEEGSFEVIASSGKVDRMGDTIDPKGWYLVNFKKNPVMLWAHNQFEPPIARADKIWVEDEKELKVQGHFADTPFAQEIKTLVSGGFLNAVSVGFLPLVEDEKGLIEIESKMYRHATDEEIKDYSEKGYYQREGQKFTKQELLEVSWVNVPALASALVSARKMNLALVAKELELIETDDAAKDAQEITEIKPYPNEHSCRLENPDKYDKFARKNCAAKKDGKCIDHIYGIKDGKSELQAMRFDKKEWDEADAKAVCTDAGGSFEPATEKSEGEKILLLETKISELETAIKTLKESPGGLAPKEDKGRNSQIKQKSNMEKLLIMFDKMCEALLKELRQQK